MLDASEISSYKNKFSERISDCTDYDWFHLGLGKSSHFNYSVCGESSY